MSIGTLAIPGWIVTFAAAKRVWLNGHCCQVSSSLE